jgi:hypothetical protein
MSDDNKWLFVAEVAIGDLARTLASSVDVDWQEISPPRVASFVRCLLDRHNWPQSFEFVVSSCVATAVLYTAEFRCPGGYGCDKTTTGDGDGNSKASGAADGCAALLRVDVLADKPSTARLFRANRHGASFRAPSSDAIDHFVDFDSAVAQIHAPGDMPPTPARLAALRSSGKRAASSSSSSTSSAAARSAARKRSRTTQPSSSSSSSSLSTNSSSRQFLLNYRVESLKLGRGLRRAVLSNDRLSSTQKQALVVLPLPRMQYYITSRRVPATSPLIPAEVNLVLVVLV